MWGFNLFNPAPWLAYGANPPLPPILTHWGIVHAAGIRYPVDMNILFDPASRRGRRPESASDIDKQVLSLQEPPFNRQLLVIAGPHAVSSYMLTLAARFAQRGPLRVLDGGNRFNAYSVARQLRRTGVQDQTTALSRIRVVRAFTCHQALSLLENTAPEPLPALGIDLLDTFYDESVDIEERRRLALKCAAHLRRLSQTAVVVVSLRPPPPPRTDPTGILGIIQEAADQFVFHEPPTPPQIPLLL